MKILRVMAVILLSTVALSALAAEWLAPAPYAVQFRDAIQVGSSPLHPLGTDELGRDRLSRLLYGTRVSLVLAPAAAFLASLLSVSLGAFAAWNGGWCERIVQIAADLFLSLPWMFLLLTVRAAAPLDLSPEISVTLTFALLGTLGWAAPSRIALASARSLCNSDFLLLARAQGFGPCRLLLIHLIPNLRPVFLAQFWTSIPLFILTEANLSLLGLGVAEPLPSLGLLLRELEDVGSIAHHPCTLVPGVVLFAVVSSLRMILPPEGATT